MYIHASRGQRFGYTQQSAKADGSGEDHHAGETLQSAHREDLLLLDTLLHPLPWDPTFRQHGNRR